MKFIPCLLSSSILLSLSSCSMFLEDEYSAVTPHVMTKISEGSVHAVETYYDLVNTLLYFVTEHMDTGQIRLVGYDKDEAKSHLSTAMSEVMAETVLGSFAVLDMNWEMNSIVGHLEAEIQITYKKSWEDYEGIVSVNGTSAMTRALIENYQVMGEQLVLHNSYSTSDRGQISKILLQAMVGAAGSLVEIPQVHLSFYPKEGPWRLVEFEFEYMLGESVRYTRQTSLETKLRGLTSQLWAQEDWDVHQTLMNQLWNNSRTEDIGSSPYDVLVRGGGNARGFALAFVALCQEMGLSATVIEGTHLGDVTYWNLITLPDERVYHVDLYQGPQSDGTFSYYSDIDMENMGYVWSRVGVKVAETYQ